MINQVIVVGITLGDGADEYILPSSVPFDPLECVRKVATVPQNTDYGGLKVTIVFQDEWSSKNVLSAGQMVQPTHRGKGGSGIEFNIHWGRSSQCTKYP